MSNCDAMERAGSDGAAIARPAGDRTALRLAAVEDPFKALGLAVAHLMGKPVHARLPFGSWSRVLAAQAGRGHCRFVIDSADRVVGLLGYALADRATAERWVAGEDVAVDGRAGDCVIFNVCSSDAREARALLLAAARQVAQGRDIFFRRIYPDGRVRPVRIQANAFVGRHLGRAKRAEREG